jgi:hypothetical protein
MLDARTGFRPPRWWLSSAIVAIRDVPPPEQSKFSRKHPPEAFSAAVERRRSWLALRASVRRWVSPLGAAGRMWMWPLSLSRLADSKGDSMLFGTSHFLGDTGRHVYHTNPSLTRRKQVRWEL